MTENTHNQPLAIPADTATLHLTPEQEMALELWNALNETEIAAAIGVPVEVVQGWQKQPFFSLALINQQEEMHASDDEIRAAFLILDGVSFADAEATLQLDQGTIKEWAIDEDSSFTQLVDSKRYEDNEKQRDAEKKVLKDQQMLAIPLILVGNTDAEVAEAVGVTRETINRWRNRDQDFRDELFNSRRACFDANMAYLSKANSRAVEVMQELLDSKDEKTRLRAAMHLLRTVNITHKR